jgi:ribosome-associated protein
MERIDYKELARKVALLIDSKKGENILIYDIRKLATFADYLIITTVNSTVQMDTVAKELLKEIEIKPDHVEGKSSSGWVLMDYSGVVINIFLPEVREFYRLERLWGEAEKLDV